MLSGCCGRVNRGGGGADRALKTRVGHTIGLRTPFSMRQHMHHVPLQHMTHIVVSGGGTEPIHLRGGTHGQNHAQMPEHHDLVEVPDAACLAVSVRVPDSVVDGAPSALGELVAAGHRGGGGRAERLAIGPQSRREARVGLYDRDPVVQRADPLQLVVLTHRLGVCAQVRRRSVTRPEAGHVRDDVSLERSVVVRACGLDGATAPPAAPRCGRAGRAGQRTGSPRGVGLGRHRHRVVNTAADVRGQGVVQLAVRPLSAGGGCPALEVVLVARGPWRVAAALPHALRHEAGDAD